MKRMYLIVACGLAFAGGTSAEPTGKVRVSGQRVNLRARADLKSEVVVQAEDGDILDVRSEGEEWLEVTPPETADLWVHKDFIQGGEVAASKLQVRAGPNINYSVVGTMERGQTVRPRGEFGEWLKIAPPPAASLWVARSYVQPLQPERPSPPPAADRPAPEAAGPPPDPKPAPAVAGPVAFSPPPPPRTPPPPAAAPAPRTVTVEAPRPPEPRPPPPGLNLIPLEGQGRVVQREGVLKYSGHLLNRPSRFRLVKAERAQTETLCYIYGNDDQLRSFLGRRLMIRGREFWVRGVRTAVVAPDQIIPRAAP